MKTFLFILNKKDVLKYLICYVSTANPDLGEEEITKILKQAQDYNDSRNITGFLLFSEDHFFQVIEGEKEEVISLFSRIRRDPRHSDIISFIEKPISKPAYDNYSVESIEEGKKFKRFDLDKHLQHLKGLDKSTRENVKNVLDTFIL